MANLKDRLSQILTYEALRVCSRVLRLFTVPLALMHMALIGDFVKKAHTGLYGYLIKRIRAVFNRVS